MAEFWIFWIFFFIAIASPFLIMLVVGLREKWKKNKNLQYYYTPVVDAPSNDDKRKVMLEILSSQWEMLRMDKDGEAVLALEAKIKKLENGEYVQAHRIIDNLSRMEGTEDIIGQIKLAGDGTHPRFIIARCEALSDVLLRHWDRLRTNPNAAAVQALEEKLQRLKNGELIQSHVIIDNLSQMFGSEEVIEEIKQVDTWT